MLIKILVVLLIILAFVGCSSGNNPIEPAEDVVQPVVAETATISPPTATTESVTAEPAAEVAKSEAENWQPALGVTVDAALQVIAIEVGSAAEQAGVQVGDILIDLAPLPPDAPMAMPVAGNVGAMHVITAPLAPGAAMTQAFVVESGQIVTGPVTHIQGEGISGEAPKHVRALPPNGSPLAAGEVITHAVELNAVPFSDKALIKSLVAYGGPLQLRVMRANQEITLMITPIPSLQNPNATSGEFF